MTLLAWIFLTLFLLSLYFLYRSIKRNLEFIDAFEQLSSQIDDTVEILDYYYKRLDKKLKIELFSDDPTIRELVEDMKQARNAVSLISEKLTGEKDGTEDKTN